MFSGAMQYILGKKYALQILPDSFYSGPKTHTVWSMYHSPLSKQVYIVAGKVI